MALKAVRPGSTQTGNNVAENITAANNTEEIIPANNHAPTATNSTSSVANLNAGILDNIDGMDSAGNFVTMDGTNFLYKATEVTTPEIELIVNYGKRYYQFVDDSDIENKQFHNSDTKLDDRYKLRFEIHWDEENEDGEVSTAQFHMPTASAMRFIDYVKTLAKAGYGIGQVVTKMTISRQTQKNSTNRYSRAEFTMVGTLDDAGNFVAVSGGPTTVGKK